jgi:hypothetical protein
MRPLILLYSLLIRDTHMPMRRRAVMQWRPRSPWVHSCTCEEPCPQFDWRPAPCPTLSAGAPRGAAEAAGSQRRDTQDGGGGRRQWRTAAAQLMVGPSTCLHVQLTALLFDATSCLLPQICVASWWACLCLRFTVAQANAWQLACPT